SNPFQHSKLISPLLALGLLRRKARRRPKAALHRFLASGVVRDGCCGIRSEKDWSRRRTAARRVRLTVFSTAKGLLNGRAVGGDSRQGQAVDFPASSRRLGREEDCANGWWSRASDDYKFTEVLGLRGLCSVMTFSGGGCSILTCGGSNGSRWRRPERLGAVTRDSRGGYDNGYRCATSCGHNEFEFGIWTRNLREIEMNLHSTSRKDTRRISSLRCQSQLFSRGIKGQ
ncbi:transferases, partial [Striga asiatica]